MQTTEIVVEILVIGGGFAMSLIPVIAMAVDLPTTALLAGVDLKQMLVVAVTVVYPLGLIWNRVADWIFSGPERRLRLQVFSDSDAYHTALVRIHLQNAEFGNRLYQVRALYRIARASTLTFALAASTVPLGLGREPKLHLSVTTTVVVCVVLFACSGLSLWTWAHMRKSFLDWAVRANGLLDDSLVAAS